MADDVDDKLSSNTTSAADAAAIAAALDRSGALDPRAAAFFEEQTRLARLQSQNLIELNAFELSHLRWRRFNDQMKGALQIMVVAVGALAVIAIGAAVWNASRAEGIMVESFSVPPQFAAAGMGGDVVADDLTRKIAAMISFANANSLAHSGDVSLDRAQEIKVEIPETGVSLAEAWRYLRSWLGHERHLDGNVRSRPDGLVALTVSIGGADSFVFVGRPEDLDALEDRAAERVFAMVEPVNYVLYLNGKGRAQESIAAAKHLIAIDQSARDLGEAYGLYADMLHNLTGDLTDAMASDRLALALDPAATPQHMEMLQLSRALGHDEEVLTQALVIATLRQEDNVISWRTGVGFPFVKQLGARYGAIETGDFVADSMIPCSASCQRADEPNYHAEAFARLHDVARAKALIADARAFGDADPSDLARTRYYLHAAERDWHAAVLDARAFDDGLLADKTESPRFQAIRIRTQGLPLLARAVLETGDIAGAEAAIADTLPDCYVCLRERGNIASFRKDWTGAASWFARAVATAPSIPFAYADWGAMLVRKGDYDAAIAKFSLAHEKGPHFADPLEEWGEALIAKNRSDLALAEFEGANRDAPKWARLHLKWGEALWWLRRENEARAQFATASSLGLSATEKARLISVTGGHG